MSGDGHTNETRELNLDAIEERAKAANISHSGHRWTLDERDTAVRANRGAGPTVCTMIPLGVEVQRANAAHIAGMDPETTLALVAEVRRLRSFAMEVQGVRGVLAKDAGDDPQGQWELGHNAACRTYLDELDNALSMLN